MSAKTGDGIGELRDELVGLLPEGPLYFPPEQRTDLPLELQIAELVREKALAPDARRGAARDHGRGRRARREASCAATIFVETESQKQILVGERRRDGARRSASRARPEIEALARPHGLPRAARQGRGRRWRRDEAMLERLGL